MRIGSDNTCMNCGRRISEDFDQCPKCWREERELTREIVRANTERAKRRSTPPGTPPVQKMDAST